MKVGELLLTNKDKYTKAFLIENDKITNEAKFTHIIEQDISEEIINLEAKDYFLLDSNAINEIFGNAEELRITNKDKVFIIGV